MSLAHHPARHLRPDRAAILAQVTTLVQPRLGLARDRLRAQQRRRLAIVRVDDFEVVAPQELVDGVAEHAREHGVGVQEASIHVEDREPHGELLEQRAEQGFRAGRGLRLAAGHGTSWHSKRRRGTPAR
jgi:hypothetical protein